METKNQNKSGDSCFSSHIDKITEPIFDKILQETSGGSLSPPLTYLKPIAWRPNKYRRQIQIRSPLLTPKGGDPLTYIKALGFVENKQNKTFWCYTWKQDLIFNLAKKTLICYWNQELYKTGEKVIYLIKAQSIEEQTKILKESAQKIHDYMDEELINVAKKLKLYIPCTKSVYVCGEDWIRGEDYIESLGLNSFFQGGICKKVYPTGVEYKTKKGEGESINLACNYLENQAVKSVMPELNTRLSTLEENLRHIPAFTEALLLEVENKKLHQAVLEEMRDTLKDIRDNLNKPSKYPQIPGWMRAR